MANLAEEMKNPKRDLPKAIILSIIVTTLLYVLVAVAAVSVMGWEDLSQTSAPLAEVAALVLGSKANIFIAIVAMASTANTVLLLLVATSRAIWAMSLSRALPYAFSLTGKKRKTPWRAIIAVSLFAILFATLGSIEQLAGYSNAAILVSFAALNVSAFKLLGLDNPSTSGPKHIVLDMAAPLIGAGISIWLAVNLGLDAALFVLVIVAAGAVAHFLHRYFNGLKGRKE